MMRMAGMVHVVPDNIRVFGDLAAQLMPGVELVHFLDTGLPAMSGPSLRPQVIERLRTYASFARRSGAEAVLLTCTAFGRLVDEVSVAVDCPVLSVLEIMVDEAVRQRGTIGIVGSHPGTVAGTERLMREQARQVGSVCAVESRLCPGAFEALRRGDRATHDRIVLESLREMVQHVDVIVAPQPSIEDAVLRFQWDTRKVPLLTSPRLSVERLKQTLDTVRSGAGRGER